MEAIIKDKDIKRLLKEIIIDMIKERKKEFIDLIEEAMADIGLANAIIEGRKNELVSEKEIFEILDS